MSHATKKGSNTPLSLLKSMSNPHNERTADRTAYETIKCNFFPFHDNLIFDVRPHRYDLALLP